MSGMVFEVGSVVSFEPVAGLAIQFSEGVIPGSLAQHRWSEAMTVVGFAIVVVGRDCWAVETELMPVFFDRSGVKQVGVPVLDGAEVKYRIGGR